MGRIDVVDVQDLNEYGLNGNIVIFRDKETGVLYMHSKLATSGGLTVLVDTKGQPIVCYSCPECGMETTPEMKICPECGYPLR